MIDDETAHRHEVILSDIFRIKEYWLKNLTDYTKKELWIIDSLSINFIDWNKLEVAKREDWHSIAMDGLKRTLDFYGKPKIDKE